MGQGEGVERAGEEGDFLGGCKGKRPLLQPVLGDEAVDVGQGRRAVEHGKGVLLGVGLGEEEQLPVAQREQVRLLVRAETIALKQQLADHQKGLLAHGLPVVGQTLEQQVQKLLVPGLVPGGGLGEAAPVGGVILQQHGNGIQGSGHGAVVG